MCSIKKRAKRGGCAKRPWLILALAAFLSPCLYPQNKPLVPESVRTSILGELSGLKAVDSIRSLCTFDRSGASKGLLDSQLWVADWLKGHGLRNVRLDAYPADGKKIYLDTQPAGYAWEKSGAVLSLVEPYKKKIIDYADVPTALVQYSNATDTTAELVDVGPGLSDKDYAGKDVKGKIVFASGPSWSVYPLANKKYGAIGIVSCWENYGPDRSQYPDQVPWLSIPQEVGTGHFGFSVSRRIADELRGLLSRGKVVLHARVDAEVKTGEFHVLSSAIEGTEFPDQEIILMAHINHHKPAANDNASGCALLMEIERAIRVLVDEGKIPAPRRTIRFVWMNEHGGSKIYLDGRPELADKGIMAINLDMVGENVLLTESVLRLTLAPHSCPSFMDDLMLHLLDHVSGAGIVERQGTKIPFSFWTERYNGAISDHCWYLSGGISIPTSFMYLDPDNFYHTQEDTPDKCDPTVLKRVGFVTMAAALYGASAGEEEALDLGSLVWAEGSKRVIQAAKENLDYLKAHKKDDLSEARKEARIKLRGNCAKEIRALRTIYRFSTAARVKTDVERQCASINRLAEEQEARLDGLYRELCAETGQTPTAVAVKPTAEERKMAHIVPIRHFRGLLNLNFVKSKIPAERGAWYDEAETRIPNFFLIQDEITNFIDNERSILDIRNAIAAEFGPIPLCDVFDFVDRARESGVVTYLNK